MLCQARNSGVQTLAALKWIAFELEPRAEEETGLNDFILLSTTRSPKWSLSFFWLFRPTFCSILHLHPTTAHYPPILWTTSRILHDRISVWRK